MNDYYFQNTTTKNKVVIRASRYADALRKLYNDYKDAHDYKHSDTLFVKE